MTLRTFSNGGGVQSTAALVLAARGDIDFRTFIHANVGDDSENPATIAYLRDVHIPYAAAHGITMVEVCYIKRDKSQPTLLQRVNHGSQRTIPIPVRMANGAPGNRSCTSDYKITPIAKWQKRNGATAANQATTGLGISLDEFQRMRTSSGIAWQRLEYPLIDLRLSRDDCKRIIAAAGLPPAPKSACWFCPFHRRKDWQEMHDNEPSLFAQSVDLERLINVRRATLKKDNVYLTPYNMPLDAVIVGHQAVMLDDDNCESGYCHS